MTTVFVYSNLIQDKALEGLYYFTTIRPSLGHKQHYFLRLASWKL